MIRITLKEIVLTLLTAAVCAVLGLVLVYYSEAITLRVEGDTGLLFKLLLAGSWLLTAAVIVPMNLIPFDSSKYIIAFAVVCALVLNFKVMPFLIEKAISSPVGDHFSTEQPAIKLYFGDESISV